MSTTAIPPGRFRQLTSALTEGIGLAVKRFPIAFLLLAAIAALVNGEIEEIYPFGRVENATVYQTLLAAIAASLVASLFAEAARYRGPSRLSLAFASALLGGALVWFGNGVFLFAPSLVIALIFAIPLTPYLGRPSAGRFWTFTLWTEFGVSLAFASVLIFILGVSAILEMIRYLFDVGLNSEAYEHIYATALTFVGPLFALGRLPTDFDEDVAFRDDARDRMASGLRVLQDWVVSPLVLVAAIVLHVYAAKILLSGSVPKNQIGWIVSGYALFVLSQRIVADPFIASGGVATRLLGRIWAFVLVVPILLLGFAVEMRIAAEGFTLERYYLTLAGISALLVVAAQIVPRIRGDVRVMAAIPLALLALSSFGPWGVMATTGRSQIGLIERDFRQDDAPLRIAGLTDQQREILRSRIVALDDVGSLPRFLPILSEADREGIAALRDTEGLRSAVMTVLKLDPAGLLITSRSFSAGKAKPLDVSGFDLFLETLTVVPQAAPPNADGKSAFAALIGDQLFVHFNGVVDHLATASLIAAVPVDQYDVSDVRSIEPRDLDVTTAGGRTVRLRITWMNYEANNNTIVSLNFSMAVHKSEWTPPSLGGDGKP